VTPDRYFLRASFSSRIFRRHRWIDLHSSGFWCSNRTIETGVLHEVGLRNTLEPDPDNTGVGSFRSRLAFYLPFH
jgi:hypothetical protein